MWSIDLLPIRIVARQLHVPLKWLKEECQAKRVPCLNAGGVLLANPDAVKRALLARATATDKSTQEAVHAAQ